jgi:2-phospho-L-lactate guanylyltransferase
MSLWAIVPVKPLRRGKSRLSHVLSGDERKKLNISLLEHTLKVLSSEPRLDAVLVVSRDPAALALARDFGARTVQEEGMPELNMALKRATIIAQMYEIGSVLVLPADLPLLSSADLTLLLAQTGAPPEVVIAPDRHHDGTNALLVNPAGLIEYTYGPGSFARHCESARLAGAALKIVEAPSLGLDLDLPEDLELLKKVQLTQPT